jgi:DNA-binding NtrC family response regulator
MAETIENYAGRRMKGAPEFSDIVAVSLEMQRAKTLAKRAADIDLPVLLEGEPGTGKRLLARAIHAASLKKDGPFHIVHFNTKNPGSDAAEGTRKHGLIDAAWEETQSGTLFLDNICDMPESEQLELHAQLTKQSLHAVPQETRVRLICASGRNLIESVKKGQFSEKLYYQISVFPIWLPPLRTRSEDIPALAEAALGQIIAEIGKPIEGIETMAESLLRSYSWPGNVRQLENTIFRAVALAEGYRLTIRDFPQLTAQIPGYYTNETDPPSMPAQAPSTQHYEGPAMIGGTMHSDRAMTLTPLGNEVMVGVPAMNLDGEFRRLDEIEADIIRLALGHYRGHITEIARRLGIGRSTLYRKMREFGLTPRHN